MKRLASAKAARPTLYLKPPLKIRMARTFAVTVLTWHVYLSCGKTASQLLSLRWEARTARSARLIIEDRSSGPRRITLATQRARRLRHSMMKPYYGGQGRARSACSLRSLATPSEWRSGPTITARPSALRVLARNALPPLAYGPHAVLWKKAGSVHDLGNIGGTMNIALPSITKVRWSALRPCPAQQRRKRLTPFCGPPRQVSAISARCPGMSRAEARGLTMRGELVGASFDASGNPRAFLWRNAVMTDLNTAVPGAPLFLLFATAINSRGEIVGFGATSSGDVHAFLATPSSEENNSESLSPMAEAPTGPSAPRRGSSQAASEGTTLRRFQSSARGAAIAGSRARSLRRRDGKTQRKPTLAKLDPAAPRVR